MTTTSLTIIPPVIPEELAFNAMQHALAYIQAELGITSGDFAGMYFSDEDNEQPVLEILASYIREEMRYRAASDEAQITPAA